MGDVRHAIVSLMDENGLNQSKLSKLSGISKSSLSRYINGEEMPVSAAKAIANALDCSTDEVLGLSTLQTTSEEKELLGYYRSMAKEQQTALLALAKSMVG